MMIGGLVVGATAGLAPAPRRRSVVHPSALRRLAQTESARWAPHQGGFRMDCPRRRLRYSVYYNNSFSTTGSFDLSVILPHFEAHYRCAVYYTRSEIAFSVHQLSAVLSSTICTSPVSIRLQTTSTRLIRFLVRCRYSLYARDQGAAHFLVLRRCDARQSHLPNCAP